MLDAALPFRAEKIESQAVVLKIGDFQKFGAKEDPLVVLQEAFKNRVLHALAVVEAGFGDVTEAALPGGGRGGDIVADEDHHGGSET